MMTKRTAEYDAFGPWIFEIDDQQTMPPLFVPYYRTDEQPLMLIKIPRKIDRRDAKPDMHLYDYVIAALSTHLYILKRVNNNVEETRLPYTNIVAAKNVSALLKGQLILFLQDETLTIDYNTVSEGIMMSLINIIREKYKTQEKVLNIRPLEYSIHTIEHRYALIIDQFKKKDNKIRLVAYQPLSILTPRKKRFYDKVVSVLSKRQVMSSTAFITNDTELIVLQRDKRVRSVRQGDLSCSMLFLPYSSVTKISRTQDETQNALSVLNIGTQAFTFSFLYGDSGRQMRELYNVLKESIGISF